MTAELMVRLTLPESVIVLDDKSILIAKADAESLLESLSLCSGRLNRPVVNVVPFSSGKFTLPTFPVGDGSGPTADSPRCPCTLQPITDEDDEWQSRLPHVERVELESAIPLADEVPHAACFRCGGLFPPRLLTRDGLCQPCALKAGPSNKTEASSEECNPSQSVSQSTPEELRNQYGETLRQYVCRVWLEQSAKFGFKRSTLSRALSSIKGSPLCKELDTATLEEILRSAGLAVPALMTTVEKAAKIKAGISRQSSNERGEGSGPAAGQDPPNPVVEHQPRSEEEPSNAAQVQEEPETASQSNDDQIKANPYCPSDIELAERQEQKVVLGVASMVESAPEPIAGLEPHVTIQVIHGLASGEPHGHLARMMRLDEAMVALFVVSVGSWLHEYSELPPFKRAEIDRQLLAQWSTRKGGKVAA